MAIFLTKTIDPLYNSEKLTLEPQIGVSSDQILSFLISLLYIEGLSIFSHLIKSIEYSANQLQIKTKMCAQRLTFS